MTMYGDFSAGWPSPSSLRAAGFSGVICYVGIGSSGKRLTSARYAMYRNAGIDVLCVFERATSDVSGGFSGGATNARAALNDMRAMGVPDSVPCFAACDSHLDSSKGVTVANAKAYANGAVSVLGKARTGFYGFDDTLGPVHAAGIVSHHWLCGSRPDPTEQSYVDFWQDNTAAGAIGVDGIMVDVDRAYRYGPNNVEDDVPLTSADLDGIANRLFTDPAFAALAARTQALSKGTNTAAWGGTTPGSEDSLGGRALGTKVDAIGAKIDAITSTEATVLTDVQAGDSGIQSIYDAVTAMRSELAALPAAVVAGLPATSGGDGLSESDVETAVQAAVSAALARITATTTLSQS